MKSYEVDTENRKEEILDLINDIEDNVTKGKNNEKPELNNK